MNCLNDYIGILGCNSSTPASGLFINSLPGMTVKAFDRLTTEEKPTYINIWDDIQLRAQKKFKQDVYSELNKRWKISNITNSLDLGRKVDTPTTTAALAEYRGFTKDLDYGFNNEEVKRSALQAHYIQTLSFYSPIVQSASVIKIFDVDLQTEIDSFTFDAVVGWNTIQVNTSYSERRIFIGVNSTNFNSVKLEIPSTAQWKCDVTRGTKVAIPPDFTTATYGNNSYGLSGVFGTRCKWDALVCGNLDVFAEAFWYLLGSETMVEALASNRVNFVTTDRKRNEYLKEVYDERYNVSLSQAALNIDLDLSDECLECNETLTVKESCF